VIRGPWLWASVAVLNLVLAGAIALLAPEHVGTTADRIGYEYVGQHPLAPDCPHNIFCYRLLVPTVLEHVPMSAQVRWRSFAVLTNAATGLLIARIAGPPTAAVLASILFQTTFAATFAVYDPFTPDPAVFLAAALIALAWLRDQPVIALIVALVGVFAKETVALVVTAASLAATVRNWRRGAWLCVAGATWLIVVGFHLAMNRLAGWSEAGSGSSDLLGGAWLGRWLADATLTPAARVLYVFIPFGFAWLYALLGVRWAPQRLQMLALGAAIVLPPLVYVQTVERALGTAAFVVVPLAALFLARGPLPLAIAAATTNGLLTARVGLSSEWLPPLPYLLALATIVGAATIVRVLRVEGSSAIAALGSSRATSSR
jgi:hypothetical protein